MTSISSVRGGQHRSLLHLTKRVLYTKTAQPSNTWACFPTSKCISVLAPVACYSVTTWKLLRAFSARLNFSFLCREGWQGVPYTNFSIKMAFLWLARKVEPKVISSHSVNYRKSCQLVQYHIPGTIYLVLYYCTGITIWTPTKTSRWSSTTEQH